MSQRLTTRYLLDNGKDYVWLLALFLAVLYSAGWISEFFLLNSLGVGSYDVPREKAVSAGIALLVFVLPQCLFLWQLMVSKGESVWKALGYYAGLSVFVSTVLGWLMALEQGGSSFPFILYIEMIGLFASVLSVSIGLLYRPVRWSMIWYKISIACGLAFSSLFVLYVFGIGILPGLGQQFGGLGHRPVDIVYASGNTERLTLLTSDDKTVTVALGPIPKRRSLITVFGRLGPVVARMKWSDIRVVRSVQNRSGDARCQIDGQPLRAVGNLSCSTGRLCRLELFD